MIIQNKTKTHSTDISFTVFKNELQKALKVVKDNAKKLGVGEVASDETIAKVSVVGIGMRSHSGIASRMFSVLAENRINIEMISTSEIKISVVVAGDKGKLAARKIHKAFGLGKKQRRSKVRVKR